MSGHCTQCPDPLVGVSYVEETLTSLMFSFNNTNNKGQLIMHRRVKAITKEKKQTRESPAERKQMATYSFLRYRTHACEREVTMDHLNFHAIGPVCSSTTDW